MAFWTFLIGAASLSALPFVTAGFYSKELILRAAWLSARGGAWLWIAGVTGAFLTSVYSFRVVFVAFLGPERAVGRKPALSMTLPLVVLAVFSIGAGLLPAVFGGPTRLVLPAGPAWVCRLSVQAIAALIPVLGIGVAALLYRARPAYAAALARRPAFAALHGFLLSGWGFDRLYRPCSSALFCGSPASTGPISSISPFAPLRGRAGSHRRCSSRPSRERSAGT